jgi:catechol 2,3-dioxygenase
MTMTTSSQTPTAAAVHPDTTIGAVQLTVSDIDRSLLFYEQALGLDASERSDGSLALGARGEPPLIELHGDPAALPLDHRATGLYHLAILMPTRLELARAAGRLARAGRRLAGASDHLVSEALYLSDPDGNGIEIYRDRPRDQWPRRAGRLEMATLPLDLESLLGELANSAKLDPAAPAGTRIGHVHLQVADLADAEAFYSGVLGFEVMVRGYPGALFLAAGGYHHHIGLNIWHSSGARRPPAGSIGLRSFEIVLPSAAELQRVLASVQASGIELQQLDDGAFVRDPSGNGVRLRSR